MSDEPKPDSGRNTSANSSGFVDRILGLSSISPSFFVDETTAETLSSLAAAARSHVPASAGTDVLVLGRRSSPPLYAASPPALASVRAPREQSVRSPGLQAARQQTVVRSDDLKSDVRWPAYSRRALDAGFSGVLALPFTAHRGLVGALSLYTEHPIVLSLEDEAVATMIALLAGPAISNSVRAEQFREALASRDSIGQAKGVIMARMAATPDRAFALLSKLSQDTNTSVADVAIRIVEHSAGLGQSSSFID